MTHSLRPWMRVSPVLTVMVFALFAAGCSSEPKPGPRAGGAPRRAFTPMAGQEDFFDGGVLAEIHVGTEGMPEPQRGGGGGGERGGGPGGRRRGGGGAGGQMSVAGGAGGFGGNISGGGAFGEGGRPARGPGGGGPRFDAAGGGRPVMIHLRFTNQTAAAVELRVTDFVSALGNFVVRPEKLVIEPGESLETEPMTSQLAGAFTEVQATLVLHLAGKSEKKAFPVRQVAPPEKPTAN